MMARCVIGWISGIFALALLGNRSAIADPLIAVPSSDVPGLTRVVLPSVTPQESEGLIHARGLPPGLISRKPPPPGGGAKAAIAPVLPASIVELARALRGDPDLIFEFVRNNIDYYPVWGVQKGALGALLDAKGTAFDQAALMVALLGQSGYSATFQYGQISLSAPDLGSWLGVSTANACAVRNLLAQGQIPIAAMSPTGVTGSCGPLVSAQISHIWVKANIGGSQYLFDPAYKPHIGTDGIDVRGASGYASAAFLAGARSGMTQTPDYVQGVNRSSIRANLTGYATALANYLRSNLPSGRLDDLVGGQTIVPYQGGPLRQTALPYVVSTTGEWPAIPPTYIPTLTVTYAGISQSFTSDVLSGAPYASL